MVHSIFLAYLPDLTVFFYNLTPQVFLGTKERPRISLLLSEPY